jgi:non-ribosomal peptide synthase protein (TIGR01720 family)
MDRAGTTLLLDEIRRTYDRLRSGSTSSCTAKGHSFVQWSRHLTAMARSAEVEDELKYWRAIEGECQADLVTDAGSGPASAGPSETLVVEISRDELRRLRKALAGVEARTYDLILAAVGAAWSWRSPGRALGALIRGNARMLINTGFDLSRTLGNFDYYFPLVVSSGQEGAQDLRPALRAVQQRLGEVPHEGVRYAVLAYQASGAPPAAEPALCVDYHGALEELVPPSSPFALSSDAIELFRPTPKARPRGISLDAYMFKNTLQMSWTFDTSAYHRDTIMELASGVAHALRSLGASS